MSEVHTAVAKAILEQRTTLAEAAVARHYAQAPELVQRYGPQGRTKCVQDVAYHLAYLSEALATAQPGLFDGYITWVKELFVGYRIPMDDLVQSLECLDDVLSMTLPADLAAISTTYIASGIGRLAQAVSLPPSFLHAQQPHAQLAAGYLQALLRGNRHMACRLVVEAAAQGVSVKELYLQVFQPCQYEIGRLWQMNQISIAQEHFCTAATQLIMAQFYPSIFATPRIGRTAIVTCVGQELHEMGARMVADFLELDGWDTVYLGANTPTASLTQMVEEHRADLVCISTTITYHLRLMKETIVALRTSVAGQCLPILVGGHPFRLAPNLWQQLGADGYAPDAEAAVALANRLTT